MSHLPQFNATRDELLTIAKIADRAWRIDWLRKSYARKSDIVMDLDAVHSNGNPLLLDDLLAADDFNFAHDMSGICRKLDRNTGQLTDHFSPRFSRRKTVRA